MRARTPVGGLCLLFVVLLQGGCASRGVLPPNDQSASGGLPRQGVPDPDYRVAAGDLLEIQRQNGVSLRAVVGADGCILLGDKSHVRVDDQTPTEIALQLHDHLGADFRDCKVKIAKFNSQFIYVFGDDRREGPRAVAYQGAETLNEFLARVGCQPCRRGYRARVVRAGESIGGGPQVKAVALDPELHDLNQEAAPIGLLANDYIYLERGGRSLLRVLRPSSE